jgi:hypothetical protein
MEKLRQLFTGKKKASSFTKELKEIRRCLRIE